MMKYPNVPGILSMVLGSKIAQTLGLCATIVGLHWIWPDMVRVISTALSMAFCIMAFASLVSLKESQKTIFYSTLSFSCAACSIVDTLILAQWEWVMAILLGGGLGWGITRSVSMIHLPQLMAFFHALVGMATALLGLVLVALHGLFSANIPMQTRWELAIGGIMAAITLTGSLIAGAKLHGWLKQDFSSLLPRHSLLFVTIASVLVGFMMVVWPNMWSMFALLLISGLWGAAIVLPIGGADMPVVISLLNACSGWATLGIGFSLEHPLFIVVGSIVGFSGAVLSWIMCKGMNRSLKDVVFPTPLSANISAPLAHTGHVQTLSPEDAAFVLSSASRVVIIPGYGMAAAHAQHVLQELNEKLSENGTVVHYAIHPVAGRMPGHMNVLLAEAKVPYESMLELDESNMELSQSDVVLIIGANDIVNTLSKDPSSSIYGMPIFNLEKVKTVLFIKRSMAAGYAGLDNPLFYEPNTFMVFGDGKKVCTDILKHM
jgi:NAD(P) transhydrogenase subunit beta